MRSNADESHHSAKPMNRYADSLQWTASNGQTAMDSLQWTDALNQARHPPALPARPCLRLPLFGAPWAVRTAAALEFATKPSVKQGAAHPCGAPLPKSLPCASVAAATAAARPTSAAARLAAISPSCETDTAPAWLRSMVAPRACCAANSAALEACTP